MAEKSVLRKKFTELRDALGEERRRLESEDITRIIIGSAEYQKARSVFLYMSFGSEVDTYSLARRILSDGKLLAVPRCDTQTRTMSAVPISDLGTLHNGAYGIPEPPTDAAAIDKNDIDLAVVPALAFDKHRMRLGYGGGYYDKFLRGYRGFSMGAAFAECVTDRLPTDEFDFAVDAVITPNGRM